MDATRWERILPLFHEAALLPAAQHAEFLAARCGGDAELVGDIMALLEEDARGSGLLDRRLPEIAHAVLDGPILTVTDIGPYRLGRVLGEGGMGVVYLAQRRDLGSVAAIKLLRDAWLSPARRERFASEQRLLAQLDHPSIAQLHDAGTLQDGTPYIIMEYVEGLPLTEYCRAHACPLPERLRLFRAVCEAVQFAHQHAVIHRDLKPSNMLVRPDGLVKLLDFGIAKQLELVDVPVAQTHTGLRLMTPAYAAPEQIRGERVGVHADIYALGVVLYELLTGRLPHDLSNRTPGEAEAIVTQEDPAKPSVAARKSESAAAGRALVQTSKASWSDLDVLCLTAMQKDPQRRYRSVDAFIRDVDHYLGGEPLEARPDSVRYRVRKFAGRHRNAVAVATVMFLTLAGAAVLHTVRLAAARDVALAEAAKAQQVSEYLISLFEASDPFNTTADSVNVRTLLDRGVARVAALSSQPQVQAQLLEVLGRVHTMVSEYDRAEPLLHRAVALRRDLNDSPLALAGSLMNLGTLHNEAGAYDSAEVAFREALALRERHLPPMDARLGVSFDALGMSLARQGKYDEAEAAYRQALRIQRAAFTGPHRELASTLNNLAVTLSERGDHAGAEQYFRESLAMSRAVYGPDHPSTAVDLANLGVVLETRGNFAAADSAMTESVRIRRLRLGTDHSETAFGLSQLGAMLRRKGDLDRAEAVLREALEIEARVYREEHRNTGFTLNSLGLALQDRGDYAAAEPVLRHSLAIFGATVGERHPLTAITRCHVGYLLHLRGRGDEADALFREGLAMLEDVLPADHDQLALNRGAYGELLTARRRFTEAEALLTDSYEKLAASFGAEHRQTRLAASRLVRLYEATNQTEKAARYRSALAASRLTGSQVR